MRRVSLRIIPPKRKRGFADVSPRFAAGNMPQDGSPAKSAELMFEGDSMPAPVVVTPDNPGNPRIVSRAADYELLALFCSRFVH